MKLTLKKKKDVLELEATCNAWDSGAYGKCFEESLTGKHVKAQGRVDYWSKLGATEIKTGAGEIADLINNKKIKYVAYEPVAQGEPFYCGIYILPRLEFLAALDRAGAIRRKTRTNGTTTISIQTFYNRSKHAPHGKLLVKMLEELRKSVGTEGDWIAHL